MRIHLSIGTLALVLVATAAAGQPNGPPVPTLVIPKIAAPPDVADFRSMAPAADAVAPLKRIDRFVQRWPDDGQPERMETIAYVGYTDDALHVVYLAFDPDPGALRAHLLRREEVFAVNDDEVELRLDTFGDGRQSYYFVSNPLGVQLDAAWPEAGGQYDESFDLVWHSYGERTARGFVVVMSIPFKSLRFHPGEHQSWGIYFGRWIPRTGEWSFWPRISNRQQSLLSQMARVDGLRGISQGRGIQVIPYAASRAFSAVDVRDPRQPATIQDLADPSVGVDAKLVLTDAVVLDLTANPDFSQVESDAPQITTNQRFEVYFPEKRPFFLENAGFLQTPINLFFTRRIEDPLGGARLTGKAGAWSVGGLVSNDEAPGKRVPPAHPLTGVDAWVGVGRLSRDLPGQSTAGGLVTRRVVHGRENTVASLDTRLRLGRVWTADAQWAGSRLGGAGARIDGSAYLAALARSGRTLSMRTEVNGRSPGFVSDLAFLPRVDVHEASQSITYTARPARALADWGPTVLVQRVWSHHGEPLDWLARPSLSFGFRRSTTLGAFVEASEVGLRPGEAPNLGATAHLRADTWGVNASTSPSPMWTASLALTRGDGVNYRPAGPMPPSVGGAATLRVSIGVRPLTPLRLDTTWLRQTLAAAVDQRVYVTDILRTRWAWQFTRVWSLRFIAQYDATASDPSLTTILPRRNLNVDLLMTRLINPWTALYAGANRNARNTSLIESDAGMRALVPTASLEPDSWQVFVKWSRLLRW